MLDTGSSYKLTAIVFHLFYRKFEQVRIKWRQEIKAVTCFCLYLSQENTGHLYVKFFSR